MVGTAFQIHIAIGIACDDASDLIAIMLDADDLFPHHYWIALLANNRCHPLPQFARAVTRIVEFIDKGFDHRAVFFGFLGE